MAVDSNNDTKRIYLTERDCNNIFCFSMKGIHLSLQRQYQFGSSLSLSGIAYFNSGFSGP